LPPLERVDEDVQSDQRLAGRRRDETSIVVGTRELHE